MIGNSKIVQVIIIAPIAGKFRVNDLRPKV